MKINKIRTLLLAAVLTGGATAASAKQVSNKNSKNQTEMTQNSKTSALGQYRNQFVSDTLLNKSDTIQALNTIAATDNQNVENAAAAKNMKKNGAYNSDSIYIYRLAYACINMILDNFKDGKKYDYTQEEDYAHKNAINKFESEEKKYNHMIELRKLEKAAIDKSKKSILSDMQTVLDYTKPCTEDENIYDLYDDLRSIRSSVKKLYTQHEQKIDTLNEDQKLICYQLATYSDYFQKLKLEKQIGDIITGLMYKYKETKDENIQDDIVKLSSYQNDLVRKEEYAKAFALNTVASPSSLLATSQDLDFLIGIVDNIVEVPSVKNESTYLGNIAMNKYYLNLIKKHLDELIKNTSQKNDLKTKFIADLENYETKFSQKSKELLKEIDKKILYLQQQAITKIDDTAIEQNKNTKHYDLKGQEIDPNKPGLHIINGKKVIVK